VLLVCVIRYLPYTAFSFILEKSFSIFSASVIENIYTITILFLVILFIFKQFTEVTELTLYEPPEQEIDLLNSTEALNYKTYSKYFYNDKDTRQFDNFTKRIRTNREPQIISLISAWGAGKTSFFRVVKGWYRENSNERLKLEQNSDLKFYEYNPWISQTQNIAEDFLNYLKSIVYTETGALLDTDINNYIESLYDNLPNHNFSWLNGVFKKQKISFQLRKQQIRGRYIQAFENQEKLRILILIDNIDRLRPQEVLTVLELIREVSDFPQITFVLAYDKILLNDLLIQATGFNSQQVKQYLQKIVEEEVEAKFGESNYEYIKNIFLGTYYEKTELGKKLNFKIHHDQHNTFFSGINFFRVLIVEVFRKKYLSLLQNNIGVEVIDEHIFFKDSHWSGFKRILDIEKTLKAQNNLDGSLIQGRLGSITFDNQSFMLYYSLVSISNMDKFLHSHYRNIYHQISNHDLKYGDKSLEQIFFEVIEDKLTMRFLKQLFREILITCEYQENSIQNLSDVQDFINQAIYKVWDK